MDRVIEMEVVGYQIRRGSEALGAVGTGNAVMLRLHFDAAWDGLAKCAKFTDARGDGGITTEIELLTRNADGSYTVPVPREAMAYEGSAELSLIGELTENGSVTKRLTTKPLTLRVYASGADREAQNTEPITATDKQQILAKVDAAEAFARGTADGFPIPERAEDNAKYYKEQAAASAEEASDRAARALVYSDDARTYAAQAQMSSSKSETAADAAQAAAETALDHVQAAAAAARRGSEYSTAAEASAMNAAASEEGAAEAARWALESAEKAVASAAPLILENASGEVISVPDSLDRKLEGLRLYGNTTQDGMPTPNAPVEMVNSGDDGSIIVKIDTEQTLTVRTPNGLPAIPVASGGNYTDENGQNWVCDEIDFGRGKRVQNIAKIVLDGTTNGRKVTGVQGDNKYGIIAVGYELLVPGCVCSHFVYSTSFIGKGTVYAADTRIRLFYTDNSLDTPDKWNAWLQAQNNNGTPVTVLVAILTPVETELSAEEL
ncbi:MAG: hypothetical protein IJ980_03245, partial [Oscillospiraceae bacterium]|nr:hypothetical protein [Oscillospiraceae bacterium]